MSILKGHRAKGQARIGILIAAALIIAVAVLLPIPARGIQATVQLGLKQKPAKGATALAQLVKEAEQNNPQILAARRQWQAATQVPSQVSTLPDPQVKVQNM